MATTVFKIFCFDILGLSCFDMSVWPFYNKVSSYTTVHEEFFINAQPLKVAF